MGSFTPHNLSKTVCVKIKTLIVNLLSSRFKSCHPDYLLRSKEIRCRKRLIFFAIKPRILFTASVLTSCVDVAPGTVGVKSKLGKLDQKVIQPGSAPMLLNEDLK